MNRPNRAAKRRAALLTAWAWVLTFVGFTGCGDAEQTASVGREGATNVVSGDNTITDAGGADLSKTGDASAANLGGDPVGNSASNGALGNGETADTNSNASDDSTSGTDGTNSSASDSNNTDATGDGSNTTNASSDGDASTDNDRIGGTTNAGGMTNAGTTQRGVSTNSGTDTPPGADGTEFVPITQAELESKRGADGVYELTFDDIKFEMEVGGEFKRGMIGEVIESLAGKPIRIRGYIFPTTMRRPKSFILVRDNMECCFGPGAALYDCVRVEMRPGKDTEYTTRPIAVEGTFSVEVIDFDGMIMSIYRLDADWAK
ncbi:MAG: DUF3299 domain-containing protein [Pirellulales bacterium]|nr:DUF3299 domain-containing protein [Pirellulales bacterium]